jgi:hypothetical protein
MLFCGIHQSRARIGDDRPNRSDIVRSEKNAPMVGQTGGFEGTVIRCFNDVVIGESTVRDRNNASICVC